MMMTTSMAMGPGASDIVRTACAAVLARPDARWTAERLAAAMARAPADGESMWNTFANVLRPAIAGLTVTIHDQIAEGDKVTVWYGSANRDEDIFPDSQTFDVGRTPNEHIAFGGRGPHYCLGASLAKMEIKVMFEEILTRIPNMTQAGDIVRLHSNLINGVKHLPVRNG